MRSFKWGLVLSIFVSTSTWAQTTASGVDYRGGDWENGITGPGMWGTLQAGQPWNFQRVTSPVRQGKYSARIELRYGDTAGPSGTSRAEAAHSLNASGSEIAPRAGETTYYGFSVMLDKNWMAPHGWGIITQLHSAYGNPAFTFQATDRFVIILNGGNTCSTQNFKKLEFSDNSLNRGAWVDFLYRVKWGSANNGEVQVWRRNQGETTFREVLNATGVSNIKSCTNDFYMKHGFYRDKTTPHTNILHLDGFSWGKTREGVMAHVFAQTTPPPSAIKIEAESGALTAPMAVVNQTGLSGGKYIKTSIAEEGAAIYNFNIPVSGFYTLEGMVSATGTGRNSVYLKFDSQPQEVWHMKVLSTFQIVKFADCDYTGVSCAPQSVYLSQGAHRLTIYGREIDTGIDYLVLRKNP